MKHYVGIAGITSLHQSTMLGNEFLKSCFSRQNKRMGMIGYCVDLTGKSVSSRCIETNKFANVLNKNQDFGVNALHLPVLADAYDDFPMQVKNLLYESGIYEQYLCPVLQINHINRLRPSSLNVIKKLMPNLTIIAQIGKVELSQKSVINFVKIIESFMPYADLFLIDPSQGQGQDFDIKLVRDKIQNLKLRHPKIGLGFAGGLNADNLLIKMTDFYQLCGPDFSIDVESFVRDEHDAFCLKKASIFIKTAAKWINQNS